MGLFKLHIILALMVLPFFLQSQICVGKKGEIEWQYWSDLFDDEIGELLSDENYPENPDYSKIIFKAQSPDNYAERMGGRMSGFISVPQADSVTFNITGNDKVRFYLSTDEQIENKQLVAYMDDWSSVAEHDKYPEQTSETIFLDANQYYYFEIYYVDYAGLDHAAIYWKTNNVNIDEWTIITADYLNGIGCQDEPCPPRYTPCDDGLENTRNDVEDGNCNCIGEIISDDACIGEWQKITKYRYDNIAGNNLSDLLDNSNFPSIPAFSAQLEYLAEPSVNNKDSIGGILQAYLTVPVTGNYQFNVTGDNQTIFFLSSDHNIENKQVTQALVSSNTQPTQHDRYIYQTTGERYLEKGKFYYIEIITKEGSGSEHFSVFWKAPFFNDDNWKRISKFYLYDYGCETACIPQGIACDDGDPFTKNDQYNEKCDCRGTPCEAPDCDEPIANYKAYDPCDNTDQLQNNANDLWLSCEMENNPNGQRYFGHWILFDLGSVHKVYDMHIWNYNAAGAIDNGFESVTIDYSSDNNNWREYGTYNWPLASGEAGYSGFRGPNFNGLELQYILITANDLNDSCRGLSKVTINACPIKGTLCDDLDDLTIGDKYDDHCNCRGYKPDENICDVDSLILENNLLSSDNYSAISYLSSESQIDSNSIASFISGEEINLAVGFETPPSTEFNALIDPCEEENKGAKIKTTNPNYASPNLNQGLLKKHVLFEVIPLEDSEDVLVKFKIEKTTNIVIDILDDQNQIFDRFVDHEFTNPGIYYKKLRTKKLEAKYFTLRFNNTSQIKHARIPHSSN